MIYVLIPTTKERREKLNKCLNALYKNAGMPFSLIIYENEPRGAVVAMHEMIQGLKDEATVWWIQDDIIVGENCLKKLYDKFMDIPQQVVYPDDGITNGTLITLPMCEVHTLREYQYKGYKHNWADREFTERLQQDGEAIYVPEATCEHQHWINNKTEVDETYKKALTLDSGDKALYESRKHLWN